MSWRSELDQHPVWTVLGQLTDTVNGDGWGDEGPEDLGRRVKSVAGYLRARFDSANAYRVSRTVLDAMQGQANNVLAAVQQVAAGQAGQIPSVHAYLDGLLDAAAPMPGLTQNQNVKAIQQTADDYERAADADLERLRQAISDAGEDLSGYKTDAAATAGKLETLVAKVDARNELNDKTFDEAEERRDLEAETHRESHEEAFKQSLRNMHDLHGQAQKILEQMAGEATTSEYAAYAKQEQRAAFWWSLGTVALGIAAAVFLVHAVSGFSADAAPAWSLVSLKAVAGVTLASVAAYAGKQANGHREQRLAKQRALALTVFEPFLANANPEAVEQLRISVMDELVRDPASSVARRSMPGWRQGMQDDDNAGD